MPFWEGELHQTSFIQTDSFYRAVHEVKSGKITIMEASKKFDISHTSLRSVLKADSKYGYRTHARLAISTEDVEIALKGWLQWR